MTISDEAVHAAASAVYGSGLDGSIQKDAWLADFRAALEAAAPYMFAEAKATAIENAADNCGDPRVGAWLRFHAAGVRRDG